MFVEAKTSAVAPLGIRCAAIGTECCCEFVVSGHGSALICDNSNTIRGDVSNMTHSSREPGWYPDPADPSKNIYWDGSAWQGSHAPVEAEKSGSSKKTGIAIGVIVLGLVGSVMAQQPVSLFSGTGQIWTGVAIAGVAAALSYFLGAGDEAHRKSPGVLVEIPHLRGSVSVVVGGCRWWCVGGFPRRRGGLGGGRTRRRG